MSKDGYWEPGWSFSNETKSCVALQSVCSIHGLPSVTVLTLWSRIPGRETCADESSTLEANSLKKSVAINTAALETICVLREGGLRTSKYRIHPQERFFISCRLSLRLLETNVADLDYGDLCQRKGF